MIRTGVVDAVPTASSNLPLGASAFVQVKLDPLSSCGSCASAGGCGVRLLPSTAHGVLIDCRNSQQLALSAGDHVQVQLPEPHSGWLRVVGLAYGVPTFGMLFGALTGYWAAETLQAPQWRELLSLLGFVAGLAGGLFAWSRAESSTNRCTSPLDAPGMASIIKSTVPKAFNQER